MVDSPGSSRDGRSISGIVTLTRTPIGAAAIAVNAAYWCLLFGVEAICALLYLPLAVIFLQRDAISKGWLSGFPHSRPMDRIREANRRIFEWIRAD